MTAPQTTPYQLFRKSFTLKNLDKVFDENLKNKTSKGIDRINAYQFHKNKNLYSKQIKIIKYKCIEKNYDFSPYVEILKTKGRNQVPRIIAVPTVRDSIVLSILKEILSTFFNDYVRRKLANTYIHEISQVTTGINPFDLEVFRTDIKNFYGSIDRKLLIKKLATRIKSKKILILIERAISTPVVPRNYRKKTLKTYISNKGIPQGLSISNILADIYVSEELDITIKNNYSCDYFRYVDDIIVFSKTENINTIKAAISDKLNLLNLEHNKEKTFSHSGGDAFEYLGYRFELPKITVRQSTIDKFIDSIAAKFSKYLHDKQQRLKTYSYLTEDRYQEIFVLELNEKITGAISGNKRYGWIFYFNAINDLSVLYKIDNIICKFFGRLKDFNCLPPNKLKKLSKAYFHVKDSRKVNRGYINNYNNYSDTNSKLIFLIKRGYLDPRKNYPNSEIDKFFQKIKEKNLAQLEKDDANIY